MSMVPLPPGWIRAYQTAPNKATFMRGWADDLYTQARVAWDSAGAKDYLDAAAAALEQARQLDARVRTGIALWVAKEIATVERIARAAAEAAECDCHAGVPADRWSYRDGSAEIEPDNESGHILLAGASHGGTWLQDEIGHHIAYHDPAAALAAVKYQRWILADHDPSQSLTGHDCPRCLDPDDPDRAQPAPCKDMRMLAQLYADRPGYQEAWRP